MARPMKVTDEQILEAARGCFVDGGPGVAISAIAERLGVSEAAIFKRFGTKERLLVLSCAPPACPDFLPLLETGPDPDRPVRAQLEELVHALIGFFRTLMPRLAVLKAAGVSPLEVLGQYDVPPPVLGHRALSAWFRAARDAGRIGPCEPDTLAFVFMGSVQGRVLLDLLVGQKLPAFDQEAYAAELVRVLVDGIGARVAP